MARGSIVDTVAGQASERLGRSDRDVGTPMLRRAVDIVQQQYDDRYPARGLANSRTREYRPLEDVSRQGSTTPYRKWESGPSVSRAERLPTSAEVIGARGYKYRRS